VNNASELTKMFDEEAEVIERLADLETNMA
jgi:hypothetical protein